MAHTTIESYYPTVASAFGAIVSLHSHSFHSRAASPARLLAFSPREVTL
jgi:hypothetical protein